MRRLEPYGEQHTRLVQIPGIDRVGAAVLIAELGVDMSVFASVRHCAAWAGVCPGNNESGGKRRGHPTRKSNVHLTTALVQAAVSASHAKGTYLKDKYWRLKARRGPGRAAMAIAHKILIAAYHMFSRRVDSWQQGAQAASPARVRAFSSSALVGTDPSEPATRDACAVQPGAGDHDLDRAGDAAGSAG